LGCHTFSASRDASLWLGNTLRILFRLFPETFTTESFSSLFSNNFSLCQKFKGFKTTNFISYFQIFFLFFENNFQILSFKLFA